MKYYFAICCIIKNENNLEEFILYNWINGAEHFYIYDNESSFPLKDRLNRVFFNKYCTIISFPGRGKQLDAYNHCLYTYGNETKWMAYIDADEFIVPKKHNTIKDFLISYDKDNVHAIGINWVFYGTSFHNNKQNGFIIDKYRYCANNQNNHIKTILKPKFTNSICNPHYANMRYPSNCIDPNENIISGPFNDNYTIDIIQINHYYTRSLEDSYEKENKGFADNVRKDIFHTHNINNDIKNDLICEKYLEKVSKYNRALSVNWKIYKALNPDLKGEIDTCIEHLFKHGIKERRHIFINDRYENYSREIYRNNYEDLNHMNDEELDLHYIYHGINEGRIMDHI